MGGLCWPCPPLPSTSLTLRGSRGRRPSRWRRRPSPHPGPGRGRGGGSGSPSTGRWSRWSLGGGTGGKRGVEGVSGGALVLAGPPKTDPLPDTMMVASSLNWTQFTFCGRNRESAPPRQPRPPKSSQSPLPLLSPHPRCPPRVLTPACPRYLRTTCPVATSHSATVLSAPQEQIWLLSKELGGERGDGAPRQWGRGVPKAWGSPQPPLSLTRRRPAPRSRVPGRCAARCPCVGSRASGTCRCRRSGSSSHPLQGVGGLR